MKKYFATAVSLSLFALLIAFCTPLQAQNKMLTIQQTMDYSLYPRSDFYSVQFVGNSNLIAFIHNDTVFMGKAGAEKKWITVAELNNALSVAGLEKLKNMRSFTAVSEQEIKFFANKSVYLFNTQKRTLSKLFDLCEGENLDVEPNTFQQAYTENNNLYVSNGSKVFSIEDPNKDIVFGQSVHRNEFGINKGTFWSPKGSFLAFSTVVVTTTSST